MIDEVRGKEYIKEIVEEYNILLHSWGHSDTWDLSQFKTLEDMIFEATKVQVNANTLKRFFQQRTKNPQLATKDALCRFLGYSGYTDFVMKRTKKEEVTGILQETAVNDVTSNLVQEPEIPHPEGKTNKAGFESRENIPEYVKKDKHVKRYVYLSIAAAVLIFGYFLYTYKLKDLYTDYLISKIEFSASHVKGICPLTITFSYQIPSALFDDISIVYEEANGDLSEKKLNKEVDKVNATYIYEGEGFCYLKYKGQTIRTYYIETRKAGWSLFVREERKNFFKVLPIQEAFNKEGYASLPIDSVPQEARANHLFVSYVYYKDQLIDGDNFIYEARLRNSAKENAIPCSDIMMYMHSDTGMHGFAMNENGYAYIKFISSEQMIKGDEHNLSRFNFNSSEWHVMSIKVVNKKTTFYVDGEEILGMEYADPLGYANEMVLRFKGCGAVDYVRLYTLDGKLVYEEDFDQTLN